MSIFVACGVSSTRSMIERMRQPLCCGGVSGSRCLPTHQRRDCKIARRFSPRWSDAFCASLCDSAELPLTLLSVLAPQSLHLWQDVRQSDATVKRADHRHSHIKHPTIELRTLVTFLPRATAPGPDTSSSLYGTAIFAPGPLPTTTRQHLDARLVIKRLVAANIKIKRAFEIPSAGDGA